MKYIITERQYSLLFEQSNVCKSKFNMTTLNDAKKWWVNRLSDPATIEKIAYNNNRGTFNKMNDQQRKKALSVASEYAKTAINAINNVNKIRFFANSDEANRKLGPKFASYSNTTLAFIEKNSPNTVFVNCENADTELDVKSVFVHELQHLIDEFLGFTADEFKNLWNLKNIPFQKDWAERKMEKANLSKVNSTNLSAKNTTDKTGGVPDYWFTKKFFLEEIKKRGKKNQWYWCSPTEFQSRVEEARLLLNLSPSQNITIDMLKNNFEAWSRLFENFLCWASRKDNITFDVYLQNMNQLAKNKSSSGSNMV